jgi:hypothetical protein
VRDLSLSNNRHLASLEGIGNIDATALGQVIITFNPKLEHCAVKSMCDLLDLPGKLYLGSNAAGCADTLALRRSCQEPNPIRKPVALKGGAWRVVPARGGGIEIRLDLAEASLVGARVYDMRGNLVVEHFWPRLGSGSQKALIPFVHRNRGVYLVEVQLGREKSVAKAIF